MLEQQSSHQPGHHENGGAVANPCSAEQHTPQRIASADHAANEMKQQAGEDARAPPRSLLSAELRADAGLKELLSPAWMSAHNERCHVQASDFLDPSLFMDDRSEVRLSAWPEAREYA